MNDDFEDWLSALNNATDRTQAEALTTEIANPDAVDMSIADNTPASTLVDTDSSAIPNVSVSSVSQPQEFTEQDFAVLLDAVNGNTTEEAITVDTRAGVWEVINDTPGENINIAPRDLDAEEDDDWEELIDSRQVAPVSIHNAAQIMANTNEDILEDLEATAPSTNVEDSNSLLISPNSPTLSVDETTSRFSGAEWFEAIRKKRVIIAGLGGIGSWTTLLLGRMGIAALDLYDDDQVEWGNMSGQLFPRSSVSDSKVHAMYSLLSNYTSIYNVFTHNLRFTEGSDNGPIMICGFDNMAARKTFFNSWKRFLRHDSASRQQALFIDGRLSMDTLQIFCIQGTDAENILRYEREFLFEDSQADATVCSMKQTSYLAAMIGSMIVNLFTNWVANNIDPIIPYDLPFFTEYSSQHMIFKTEH